MAVAVVVDLPECARLCDEVCAAVARLAAPPPVYLAVVVVVVDEAVCAEVGSRLPARVDRVVIREGAGGGSG